MATRASSPLVSGVELRDVIEADLPIFFEHQHDPDAARMAAFPSRGEDSLADEAAGEVVEEYILKLDASASDEAQQA